MTLKRELQIFTFLAPTTCPIISPGVSIQAVNGRLYHTSEYELNWKYAKEYCNQLHLELASVATKDDYDNVVSILGGYIIQLESLSNNGICMFTYTINRKQSDMKV